MSDIILEGMNLVRHFKSGSGFLSEPKVVRAVDGVSVQIRKGETFAIVGESGCGKSTLARLLMHLLEPTSGDVIFDGERISERSDLSTLRREMQFIFQDPFSSLNPRLTAGKLISEPLEVHAPELDAAARRARVADLLAQVGLLPEHANRYPHEFSGGQRQRIGIARALASGPKLIIGDEPVSALDVSVQAQVINLLGDLGRDLGLTFVIVAHDLAVIRHISDRVAVMYLGRIVESGPVDEIFQHPRHPYTQLLLSAIPVPEVPEAPRAEPEIASEMPSPSRPPQGCHFHTRCPHVQAGCKTDTPSLTEDGDGHSVACHHWAEIAPPSAIRPPRPRTTSATNRFALYSAAVEGAALQHTDLTNRED